MHFRMLMGFFLLNIFHFLVFSWLILWTSFWRRLPRLTARCWLLALLRLIFLSIFSIFLWLLSGRLISVLRLFRLSLSFGLDLFLISLVAFLMRIKVLIFLLLTLLFFRLLLDFLGGVLIATILSFRDFYLQISLRHRLVLELIRSVQRVKHVLDCVWWLLERVRLRKRITQVSLLIKINEWLQLLLAWLEITFLVTLIILRILRG